MCIKALVQAVVLLQPTNPTGSNTLRSAMVLTMWRADPRRATHSYINKGYRTITKHVINNASLASGWPHHPLSKVSVHLLFFLPVSLYKRMFSLKYMILYFSTVQLFFINGINVDVRLVFLDVSCDEKLLITFTFESP